MRLRGKVAVITGAAQGIGKGTAAVFAREGAAVCLVDTDEQRGRATAASLEAEGSNVMFMRGDVSSAADASSCIEAVLARHGRIDILVNNAAIAIIGSVMQLSEADWDRTLAVNLKSIFLFSRLAIPHMARSGGGAILNIASITGLVAVRDHAAYCASKGGVIALSRAMALDHAAQGIRVNAICPSGIMTSQMEALFAHDPNPQQARADVIAKHPAGRMAAPEEVAGLLVYLASDEASFITGSVYTFDGGYTAI